MNDEKVFSVSQVNRYINHIISEDIALSSILIEGEVSNYKTSGGNAYFSIKDEDSALDCIQFGAVGYSPQIGEKVIINGKANFYMKSGKFSLIVKSIKPYGMGEIYSQFLIVKEKLQKLGLFSSQHKKPIPKYPNRIGVISSEKGAVIQDIINVTKRRNPFVDIVLYPAKVQGVDAENEIANGIDYFNFSDVDTVIIARGGGSLEDMAAFYTEFLALKVFDCLKPIITAIGHETDTSLVDYVSDMRAPTPSAAAELAVPKFNDIISEYKYYLQKISNVISNKYNNKINKIKFAYQDFAQAIDSKIMQCEHQASLYSNQISTLNPMQVLLRGFAKVRKNSMEVSSVSGLGIGDDINILFHDGNVDCKVCDIKGEKK